MGWKRVKESYGIDHIVKMEAGDLKIGSAYVGDLITVKPDGKVSVSSIVKDDHGELSRIRNELETDTAKLLHLLQAPDSFEGSLPVWTYEDGRILELECEEYGWPNVTHDGRLMYENLFFDRRDQAVKAAIRSGQYSVEGWAENVEMAEKDLAEKREHLARARRNLEAYRSAG